MNTRYLYLRRNHHIHGQSVATPDHKHGQHQEEEEGGDNREGSGLDKGERGQLIYFFSKYYLNLVLGECIVHFSKYIHENKSEKPITILILNIMSPSYSISSAHHNLIKILNRLSRIRFTVQFSGKGHCNNET